MDFELAFLNALRGSRSDWDEAPDWRAALRLYRELSPAEARSLDAAVLRMVDQDYRNPHSSHESLPFDDVQVNLPAGMVPEDLLCIESAVLVAAERGIGQAYFAFNRLMRQPRWHAMSARLHFLNYEGPAAQRQLAATCWGRHHGALVGLALAEALRGEGDLAVGDWGRLTNDALALAASEPEKGLASLLPEPHRQELANTLAGGADLEPGPSAGNGRSLEESLRQALNFSEGDRAARGALAGARFGPLSAPRAWSSALRDRLLLEEAAERFARTLCHQT